MRIKNKLLAVGLILIFLTVTTALVAQEQVSLRTSADRLYYQGEYFSAANIYLKLVDVKKPKTNDMEKLADCYYQIREYESAENWYARVIPTAVFSDQTHLNYIDVLRKVGNYADAKLQLQDFKGRVSRGREVDNALKGVDSALVWMANPTMHKLINQEHVNTRFSQFGGFPISNGILYSGEPDGFQSDIAGRTGRSFLRAYSASVEQDGLTLQYPSILPEAFNNVPYHIGVIIANKNQDKLYATRTYLGTETEKIKVKNFRFDQRNLELLIYTKNGDQWVESAFMYNNSQEYSVGHAALSLDEKTLYFVSNMPGGHGGTDIWYCPLLDDGSWGEPVNAGAVVNSEGNELFPYVYGDKLYYSSDGFVGMGGLDIYEALGERHSFSNQRNLGFPINSAFDDFAFIPVGESQKNQFGYVSSDRTGGMGLDDIYAFTFDKPIGKIKVDGKTVNAKTDEILADVQLALTDERGLALMSTRSDANGAFSFYLEDDEVYNLTAATKDFHRDVQRIVTVFSPRDTILPVAMRLEPFKEKGSFFVLQYIYYDLDKYDIREDAKLVLNQLVKSMRDNPKVRIELSSHTDSRGSNKYNLTLSQKRAQAAVDYLVANGIARDRLEARGYGEEKLLNHCSRGVKCSDKEHELNRRTEIKVISD